VIGLGDFTPPGVGSSGQSTICAAGPIMRAMATDRKASAALEAFTDGTIELAKGARLQPYRLQGDAGATWDNRSHRTAGPKR